ncbi:MAG: hypothetical protein QM479_05335 [Pseudomonadota bacterium]
MLFDLNDIEPTKVSHLLRLYNSKGNANATYDAFWSSSGPDRRLSSEKYNIKMGYWAPHIESCFLEVFLRRRPGFFVPEMEANIDCDTQLRYHIAKLTLAHSLTLVPHTVQDIVCSSAYYSNELEKDNFVKHCYDHPIGFDGIEYRSNHSSSFICYALFDRSIQKLKLESNLPNNHFECQPLSNSPRDMLQVLKAFSGVTFERC